jgi:hypothetical protein
VPVSYQPSAQQRWLLKVGQESCWLPDIPAISSVGQLTLKADACFVLTFHPWLSAWLAGTGPPLSGEISAFDYGLNEKLRYTFIGASVTSVEFPALDGALQIPGRVTLGIQAKSLTPAFGSGQHDIPAVKQIPWRCSDFRVVIANVDAARVSHVDAIDVPIADGVTRVNLLVPASSVKQFIDWQASGDAAAAKIHFLAPDQVKSLFALEFTAQVRSVQRATGGANGSRGQSSQAGKVPVALTAAAFSLAKG